MDLRNSVRNDAVGPKGPEITIPQALDEMRSVIAQIEKNLFMSEDNQLTPGNFPESAEYLESYRNTILMLTGRLHSIRRATQIVVG